MIENKLFKVLGHFIHFLKGVIFAKKNKIMNECGNINHDLLIYKMITMASMGFCLLLVALCFYLNDKNATGYQGGMRRFHLFHGESERDCSN